jgi:hypothetical protein
MKAQHIIEGEKKTRKFFLSKDQQFSRGFSGK